MSDFHLNGLPQRIYQALKHGADQILLCDDRVAWSGYEIQLRIKQIEAILETLTPPGAKIAVAFPAFAVQALAILSVMACSRVPVVLDSNDLSSGATGRDRLKIENVRLLLSIAGNDDSLSEGLSSILLSQDGTVVASNGFPNQRATGAGMAAPGTAMVLFTSGSTGQPKGIHVPEAGLLKTVDYLTDYFKLDSSTIAPIALPISHSMALNTQLLPTFLASGRSHVMNSWASVGRMYRSILAQKGTFVSLIGDMLRICWDEKTRRQLPAAEHVQHVQLAGGMILDRHIQLARELFPNAILHKGYGLTEAIRVSMINSLEPGFDSASVGRPLPFLDVEVRAPNGRPIGPSMVGEIHVRGPSVMLGASGVKQPRIGADSFLATGDLGYWNKEHQLCISGRADGVVKINGHRVACAEIEQLALETSDLVRNAKCLGIESCDRAIEKMVLMLEVPDDVQDEFLDVDGYSERIWKKFRGLQHFPKEILLLTRFPRRVNGKLALTELRNLYDLHMQNQLQNRRAVALKIPSSRIQFYKLPANEPDDHASA